MNEDTLLHDRSQTRQYLAVILIGVATAQLLGLTLKTLTQQGANDISRWCTVWSLLERGTYAIDECPWQHKTQDKVRKTVTEGGASVVHFYSSKPPLLPTLMAGILYPIRVLTGVPLDSTMEEEPSMRWVEKEKEDAPGQFEFVYEKPKEPIRWPVYVFYLKPMVVLLNVVPLWVFLVLYARLLDRYAANDWAWILSLFTAAWGTQLFAFDQTLNNHTVAAYSAFFAIYAFLKIWNDGQRTAAPFALAGFFAAFCACNELPAALFGLVLFGMLLVKAPRQTLYYFAPAAAMPCIAFLTSQYLAMGTLKLAYEEFGTKAYEYEGSYWTTPLEFDYLNKYPEPKFLYLFHMVLGHHGVLSLTPIFLFSAYAVFEHLRGRMRQLSALAWLTAFLSVTIIAFYAWNPKARNYGGSTQGLRWLFWLFPFWLVMLPPGLEPAQNRPWVRRLSLAALLFSVFSIGYAVRSPWSHPWLVDLLEHLDLYTIKR